jgi:hypothetical protein
MLTPKVATCAIIWILILFGISFCVMISGTWTECSFPQTFAICTDILSAICTISICFCRLGHVDDVTSLILSSFVLGLQLTLFIMYLFISSTWHPICIYYITLYHWYFFAIVLQGCHVLFAAFAIYSLLPHNDLGL